MQKIGIGYESYTRIIDDKCYLVDKTRIISDIVEKGGMVTLFTRPRRFGKTLTQSMLRTFFEEEFDRDGKPIDKKRYFEGKKIMDTGEEILSRMGKYPVIFLSLKSAKQPDFRTAFDKLREGIIGEIDRHSYLWDSEKLLPKDIRMLRNLDEPVAISELRDEMDFMEETGRYATSLRFLSECLEKHHGRKTIILIDEYDVPLENAYYCGFYSKMTSFIRSLFESCLKTNDALEFAVITGCLRISKESIFTGMNNLKINSIRGERFSEGFGFTKDEVQQLLSTYRLEDKIDEVLAWYDGYCFGDSEIYNPWSVLNYVDDHFEDSSRLPEPYWSNTSSNQIIKDLIEKADDKTRRELDILIDGGTIEKQIHEDITYEDIYRTKDNLWNFLFFTGYMRKVSERMEGNDVYMTMRIPNLEIRSVYSNKIREWFKETVSKADHSIFYASVLAGDTEKISDYLTSLLQKTISTFDSAESFYHGFFLSLLYGVPLYAPRSNREEGDGRPDITLYPDRPKDPAIIFEIKIRKKYSEMEDGLEEAYKQIRDQRYEEGILEDGYIGSVAYGVCFCKKSCIIGKYSG